MKTRKISFADVDPRSMWDLAIDPNETGRTWRRMRKALNLTQDDLSDIFYALDMPMSKAAISAVETGRNRPSLDHAFLFAQLCECPVDDLVITFRKANSRERDDPDQVIPLFLI